MRASSVVASQYLYWFCHNRDHRQNRERDSSHDRRSPAPVRSVRFVPVTNRHCNTGFVLGFVAYCSPAPCPHQFAGQSRLLAALSFPTVVDSS
ncbi:unnamed protein product [Linum trigynum]|uniref:Uncharacterized protein n=1 Tax=Linum trigynum TaxID=586398 RepID=A0AAV2ENF7_9ROSI